MTVIEGVGFTGSDTLTREDVSSLVVDRPEETAPKLAAGWKEKAGAAVSIFLRNDNEAVDQIRLTLHGEFLDKPKKFATAKFWRDKNISSLTLHSLKGSLFSFPNGELASSFVDHSALNYSLRTGDKETKSRDDLDDLELDGFSVRMLLAPCLADWAKFFLLLFPLPAADLQGDHELSSSPSFPGFKLWQGDIHLGPQSATLFPTKRWGSPLAPGLIPGCPWDRSEGFPSSDSLKWAIASFLRKAVFPTLVNSLDEWTEFLITLQSQGEDALDVYEPRTRWPRPSTPRPQHKGRTACPFFFSALSNFLSVFFC